MGRERSVDVPVYDLSLIRGIWEVRVKKHRQKQKKEQERREKSALARYEAPDGQLMVTVTRLSVCLQD